MESYTVMCEYGPREKRICETSEYDTLKDAIESYRMARNLIVRSGATARLHVMTSDGQDGFSVLITNGDVMLI